MKFYTYTGKMIELTSPDKDAIDSRDIAHALSQLCRAAGHFKHFYSVGQHSINCMREAMARGFSKRVCMACLLHDASEAYLCDIPSPLKADLGDYKKIEAKFEDAVWKRYGLYPLSDDEKYLVKLIDEAVLWYEFKMIHTIPIEFNKTPNLASVPMVDFCDMKSVEEMFFKQLANFEKMKKTA